MTELERCMAGEFYDCHDDVFIKMKAVATLWMQRYNSLSYEQRKQRYSMLKELFAEVGENCSVADGFICGFGCNIFLGNNVSINYRCTLIDCNTIKIGNNVLIAPGVQINTASHPVEWPERRNPDFENNPQAYFCKKEGVTNITTETGAGQWGASMAMAAKHFGLELAVYMVKVSYNQKPYRRSMMQTFGAEVIASPSMSTRAGRDIITKHPNYQGSLGTAISEAVELAMQTPNCKYVLGSVLNHVMLHQTVIGLEAEKQMEMAGEYPDVVIACFGGGSNFSGIAFPFLRHKLTQGKDIRIVAAEPASCPKLTRGQFQYDFGDEAGYTPLLPMFTLGHNFAPANIHAGGLRYHGAGSIVSQLKKDGLMDAVDIQQLETFKAATLFAQSEGIIPAPESSHAIAAAIREAEQAKIEGKPRTILFNLSGHGLIDMAAYDQYLAGDLTNYEVTDADVEKNLSEIEKIIK